MIVKGVLDQSVPCGRKISVERKGCFVVISLFFHQKAQSFCVLEDNYPVVHDAKFFEIVDPEIPAGWGVVREGDGYTIAPLPFGRDNFWGDFHDDVRYAKLIFQEEYNKIATFHGFDLLDLEIPEKKDVADLLWEQGFKLKG